MKKRQLIILWVIVSLTYLSISLAQPELEVTGIIGGEEPLAIVNGKIVKKGGSIKDALVVDIGENFVRFEFEGTSFEIKLMAE